MLLLFVSFCHKGSQVLRCFTRPFASGNNWDGNFSNSRAQAVSLTFAPPPMQRDKLELWLPVQAREKVHTKVFAVAFF